MNRYTVSEFVEQTAQRDRGQGLFELETERMLEINLNGMIWTKMGSMVSYVGDVKFTREGILEHGLGKLLKKAISGEGHDSPKRKVSAASISPTKARKLRSSISRTKRSSSTATMSSLSKTRSSGTSK